MEESIRFHLQEIEASEHVRVVYACESGSRAWGFPSADSDYDVRFLYVRPLEWYRSIEKYFYVLRPILAMNWIENGLGVVPTDFNILVERLVSDPKLRAEIGRLLSAKRAGAELDRGPRIELISEFIEREFERWETRDIADHKRTVPSDKLDELFRESLTEVWRS